MKSQVFEMNKPAGLKANWLTWPLLLLLLLLKTAVAQQSTNYQPDAANKTATSTAATKNSGMDEIKTLDGWIYKSAQVVKVESDGIEINYVPNGGGIGIIKIQFENLPDDLRRRFSGSSSDTNIVFNEAATKKLNAAKALAERGDAGAQFDLAECYIFGTGVAENVDAACKWLRIAAGQGNPSAQEELANGLKDGGFFPGRQKIQKNTSEAAKWFLRAARQGSIVSQLAIGQMYAEGEGVPQNVVEAYKWLYIASVSTRAVEDDKMYGNKLLVESDKAIIEQARAEKVNLAQKMTAEQIAKSQLLAGEFIPRKEIQESSANGSAKSQSPSASGTGFFITNDGYLISNYHVVKNAAKVRLLTGTGLLDATVVKVDAANDLALLKADGRFDPLPIAASRAAKLGCTVATVGFPNIGMQGFAPKLAKGEIASLSGAADDPRYFQISVPVQPGNSGGALVDERGNVIGIVSAKLNASAALAASGALPENVNYAVKSSLLLSFLESVPEVDAKLKSPVTADRKFEEVVRSAQDAAVLVLVY